MGRTIPRRDENVVRNLADVFKWGGTHFTRGVQSIGIALLGHTIPTEDILFTEARPAAQQLPEYNGNNFIKYVRTHLAARPLVNDSETFLEFVDTTTGNVVYTVSMNEKIERRTIYGNILFEQAYEFDDESDLEDDDEGNLVSHIIPLDNPGKTFTVVAEGWGKVVFNERFLVNTNTGYHDNDDSFIESVKLVRVDTGQEIALLGFTPEDNITNIKLTRFHLLVFSAMQSHPRTHSCRVYDLSTLRYLYKFDTPSSFPFPHTHDRFLYFPIERDLPRVDADVNVLDPLRKTRSVYVRPVLDRKVCSRLRNKRATNGYFVAVNEYPVGVDGKRTGSRGEGKLYWRETQPRNV
ncbi:hypothetical protein HDV00_010098 [Rhizophlyctis rosea]|nr:hypothetical protein HDV00_010098 [Rhizophlyctis rosea]